MDNITHTVKEKMQKTYSFTGTQLLVTGLGVVILLSILACAGRGHGGPRAMMNHDMRGGKQEMMQMRDNKKSNQQDMRRGEDYQGINNRKEQQPMMNDNQNNQPTTNQVQTTPPSAPTNTGN